MSELNKANLGRSTKIALPKRRGNQAYLSKSMTVSGWVDNDVDPLSRFYKVCINSSNLNTTVVAALQEQVTFRITSEWDSFIPIGNFKLANVLMQMGGHTPVTKFSTRRIWKATSPITLNLKLKFQTVTDTLKNVIQPYMALMQMILPGEGEALNASMLPGMGSVNFLKKKSVSFLTPPGPGPFYSKSGPTVGGKTITGLRGGDNISIGIGRFLFLNRVIIREVVPVFDTKMDENGWPVSAEISVVVETYEVMTKGDMFKAFNHGGNSKMKHGGAK